MHDLVWRVYTHNLRFSRVFLCAYICTDSIVCIPCRFIHIKIKKKIERGLKRNVRSEPL